MADDMTGDDGLTQRERRAQRHRQTKRTSAPKDWARGFNQAKPFIIIGVIVLAGAGAIWYFNQGPSCPDHWHGTFAVFTPTPGATASGGFDTPHRIDWNSPTSANGAPYYNYGTDQAMSPTVHMHQSGPEQGSAALGPAQFHFEGGGKCIGIQNAFHVVDLSVSTGHVAVDPNTPLAKANPGGPWNDNGNHTLHFFLESKDGSGQWVWSEKNFRDYEHYQMHDGESIMLAFGHYSDAQIKDMQSQVPSPSSRVLTPVTSSTTSASSATTATNSTASSSTT